MLSELNSFTSWHAKLGHPNSNKVSKIIKDNALPLSTTAVSSSSCESCKFSKMAKLSLSSFEHTSCTPFAIIYSDVWGPSPVLSNLGFHYFLIFVDDFTRYTWLFPLRNKSDVFQTFKDFDAFLFAI